MQSKELIATLPASINEERFFACVKAGMNRVRIHAAKMDENGIARLLELSKKYEASTSLDLPGKKGRVLKSNGMIQVQTGLEKGNWLKTLDIGEEILLVPTGKDFQTGIFECQMTCLPQVFTGNGSERINFADGKIVANVVDTVKNEGKTIAIRLQITDVHDTEGLFWKMGINSDTNDIFSGDDCVLTETDIAKLRILRQITTALPTQIALSFVSTREQIVEAKRMLKEEGFDVPTLAKIETLRGVTNICEIAKETDVEVARGDLEEACKQGKVSLRESEQKIVEAANLAGRQVIIATHVANSLIPKIKSGEEKIGLSKSEKVAVWAQYPFSDGFMLAAETMITGDNAEQVIRSTNRAIQVARRYWQIWR